VRARHTALRRGLTLGTVTLAISAGLTTGTSTATPPAGPDPGRAATPVLDWVPCPEGSGPPSAMCATARIPLSYRDPAGPQISLALTKRPATDPQHKIGTVFTNRPTANPVLLVGNRLGDPATPYEDAVSTSHLLGRARLLTVDIAGHGVAYDGRNQCVDNWLDGYLVSLTLPPAGTVCAAERGPFDPPPASRCPLVGPTCRRIARTAGRPASSSDFRTPSL
jgi:hypothetical protein